MSSALHDAILERLAADPLPDAAADHLLAAVLAAEGADQEAGGEPAKGVYLKSVSVGGFRGIGPTARIDFKPGPGLTVMCGRNGSGKSSFAEALEMLVTGQVRRLKGRTGIWRSGWRSLHSPAAPEVRAELTMDGSRGATLVGTWGEGAFLDGCEVRVKIPGEPDSGRERFGWERPLELYRPFLSHSELEVILDRPSELHDQLNSVLGLEELNVLVRTLTDRRKAQDELAKAVTTTLSQLKLDLAACPDPRAGQVAVLLEGRKSDLDAVEALAAGTGGVPSGELGLLDSLRRLTVASPAEVNAVRHQLLDAAGRLERSSLGAAGLAAGSADLLSAAVAHFDRHGPSDCPVCGRSGALDDEWLAVTRAQIEALRVEAEEMRAAQDAALAATTAADRLLSAPPASLDEANKVGLDASAAQQAWTAWSQCESRTGDPTALRDFGEHLQSGHGPLLRAVEELSRAASVEYDLRQDSWSPLAARIFAWCAQEREALQARQTGKDIKKAEDWLKAANHDFRNQRLRPYVDRASHIWEQLRQESNVDLRNITLEGSRTRREVDFELTVDGTNAPGLPVLSQGETNALALSVFLPRATAGDSPFRFVVIDDPVQAMDPAKVDGLARVLAQVAVDRQVIVLTHDDRLPAAVRRLGLGGRIIQVTRSPGSVVQISSAAAPSEQLLSEAARLARETALPAGSAARVIPGLCREAIETVCYEICRARRLGRGDSHTSVEEAIAEPTTLVMRLALAIHDDPSRGGDVYTWLNRNIGPWSYDLVQTCNKGTHIATQLDGKGLVEDARKMIAQMRSKLP